MITTITLFFLLWCSYLLHQDEKRARREAIRKAKLDARRVTLYGGRAV